MFGIGAEELILIFIIALFVLGPERLPSLARDLGKAVRELRRASDELTEQFLHADEPRPAPPPPASALPEPAPTSSSQPEATASMERPPEDKTEFDRKAQEEAAREHERGEVTPPASSSAPPHEPEHRG